MGLVGLLLLALGIWLIVTGQVLLGVLVIVIGLLIDGAVVRRVNRW